tara:strand:- start:134 stop:847 length:714 start_codon:yes stop_codon:yes gene_type:complete
MNILWYNTWTLPFITNMNYINSSINYIEKNVLKYNIDIIGLAELFDNSTRDIYIDYFVNKFNYEVLDIRDGTTSWGKQTSGLLIFYKNNIKIVDYKYHIYTECGLIDCFSSKSLIGLYIKNKYNETLLICFSHLQDKDVWYYNNYCKIVNAKQFKKMNDLIKEWSNNIEYISIGDFNIEPKEIPIENLNIIKSEDYTHYNKIYDYAFSSSNLKDKIKITTSEIENNPSDHKLIIIKL